MHDIETGFAKDRNQSKQGPQVIQRRYFSCNRNVEDTNSLIDVPGQLGFACIDTKRHLKMLREHMKMPE